MAVRLPMQSTVTDGTAETAAGAAGQLALTSLLNAPIFFGACLRALSSFAIFYIFGAALSSKRAYKAAYMRKDGGANTRKGMQTCANKHKAARFGIKVQWYM